MLLRIEVFQPAAKGSSNDDNDANRKPSQILYCSPSTVANRLKASDSTASNTHATASHNNNNNDDDDDDATVDSNDPTTATKKQLQPQHPNAGLVARIGRKGDVDVLFGTDRSISREHALLRFVGLPKTSGANTRTRSRKSSDDDQNQFRAGGWCFEPRNEQEAAACEASPYGMCVVLENKGKSGSYVASEDKTSPMETSDKAKANANANEGDSDATTDDEAGRGSQYRSSQAFDPGTAASLATQTGEILVSRTTANLASAPQSLPSLSGAVRHYFGNDTPVRLTKLDAGETHVLAFGDEEAAATAATTTTTTTTTTTNRFNQREAPFRDGSVLVQFGVAQLPTIKITRIPMNVVFSSGVPVSVQDSLRFCGGLVQEPGTLPRSDSIQNTNGTANANANTTHLVTPKRMPVAKQLIAWCYEIPIVSPDFVMALRDHSDLSDPFPDPARFPPLSTDTMDFWESKRPKKDLLSGYVMLGTDPSPEIEGLARAAGARVEQMYAKRKAHTKAEVTAFVKHAESLLEPGARADGGGDGGPSSAHRPTVVLLASGTKSKSSNAKTNTALLIETLRDKLGIPTVSSKILAKTITQQESRMVGLKPIDGGISTRETSSASETTTRRSASQCPPSSEPRATRSTSHKRGREEVSSDGRGREMGSEHEREELAGMDFNSLAANDHEEIRSDRVRSDTGTRRDRDREEANQQRLRRQPPPPLREVPRDDLLQASAASPEALEEATEPIHGTHGPTQLGHADANGWFQPAPKDDHERSKWRQRASEVYRTKTGVQLERSAPTDRDLRILVVDASNATTTANSILNRALNAPVNRRHPTPSGVPNFKRFRKNRITRADPSRGVVMLTQALSASKRDQREMNAEEKEMEEEQRLADALFRGEAIPDGMGQKKRRVRR